MFHTSIKRYAVTAVIVASGFGSTTLWASGLHDLTVTLPKRSKMTPVQRLNREGVEAVEKHHYEKAEAIFYKAYLYDAADPFTLNNLGYVSELQGNLDRAQTFYALAAEQDCDAVIDMSNKKQLRGKPMTYALTELKDVPMRVNRMNVDAIELLHQNRGYEADLLLKQALALDPQNPFTLNNLGVAEEAMGNFQGALQHYDQAASINSPEPIVVTLKKSWRGKPVSRMAAESAQALRKKMRDMTSAETQATMLTYRGIYAANENDWATAKQDFQKAYSLDPESAFTLNNLGYVAEKDGDLETAQFYYSRARRAQDANAQVGLATARDAEGQNLVAVAGESNVLVNDEISRYSQAERMQTGPVELIPRDNISAQPAQQPKAPSPTATPTQQPAAQSQPNSSTNVFPNNGSQASN
jgi:tetratricopeptide (TPR) repeat protein